MPFSAPLAVVMFSYYILFYRKSTVFIPKIIFFYFRYPSNTSRSIIPRNPTQAPTAPARGFSAMSAESSENTVNFGRLL